MTKKSKEAFICGVYPSARVAIGDFVHVFISNSSDTGVREASFAFNLKKNEWKRLLNFLDETIEAKVFPPGKIAFTSFTIKSNKIFYVDDSQQRKSIKHFQKILEKYQIQKKDWNEISRIHNLIQRKIKERQEMLDGEKLDVQIYIRNNNFSITLCRENFKRFRDACFFCRASLSVQTSGET